MAAGEMAVDEKADEKVADGEVEGRAARLLTDLAAEITGAAVRLAAANHELTSRLAEQNGLDLAA